MDDTDLSIAARWRKAFDLSPHGLAGFGLSALIVLVASAAAFPFREMTEPENLTMVYVLAVVFVALRLGLAPAILASVVSVGAFNFLFTPPYYSFSALNSASYITFGIMLVASLLAAVLTSGLSARLAEAAVAQNQTRLLLDLSRDLSRARSFKEVEAALTRLLEPRYGASLRLEAGHDLPLAPQWTGKRWLQPLLAQEKALAVLALDFADVQRASGAEQLELETVATLAAGELSRIIEADHASHAVAEQETERLRNVLLSSLSHDLRTPLTVLSGTVASLLRMRRRLPREAVDEVVELQQQITRLQKFTGNLLKMAAISAGQLKLNAEPYALTEILGAALQRMADIRERRQLRTAISGEIPMVVVDGALIEQVFSNLIENAISHTRENGVILISLERAAGKVRASVSDDGPGLSPGDEDVVFERFRTGTAGLSDRKGPGSHGLGLAICRGIVEAHGGRIDARNNPDGKGACFSFTLPLPKEGEDA